MKKQSKPKKAIINPEASFEGLTVTGQIKLLMMSTYKNGRIYIRRVHDEMFLWDVVWEGEIYSSFFVIKPSAGKTDLTEDEVHEVTKMCYAGAAATIDFKRGDEMADTDDHLVKMFEEARTKMNANLN